MDGFRSSFEKHAPACVNLYVTDWTLNSAGKYAAGALAAFSVGLAVEALSRYRKKLYAALVDAYMRKLIVEGFPIEFFIEGGRSRTGKLLAPKYGLLTMIVDAALKLRLDDVHFIHC